MESWWTFNFSEDLYHDQNYFYGLGSQTYKKQVLVFNSTISTNLILNKDKDWNVEVGHEYSSQGIQATFDYTGIWTAYLVMNRKFFNKKVEATLLFDDIFKTSKQKIATKYANQDSYFYDYQDTQLVSMSLKYNFGRQSVKATKSLKKVEEQSRL